MKKTFLVLGLVVSLITTPVFAASETKISETKKQAIITNCESIIEKLRTVQHEDSKARVYLGRYYETIQSKFITPLNVRLAENTLSSDGFVKNQNDFDTARSRFMIRFVESQKALDDLISTDCKKQPEEFYTKLDDVRDKRKVVAEDVADIRKLIKNHVTLVKKLGEKL